MEIKINKEIRDYTESIVLGLSFRQCFFSVIACIVAVAIYFSVKDIIGIELTSWLCMLGAAPFASLGFISYQGMNTETIVRNALRSFLLSKSQLIYKPKNVYYELLKENIEESRRRSIDPNDKKLRENKKAKQGKI